jgi:predicted nucleotidyltransferase
LKSIALAPHQVRALDSLGVLFASHRSVLIGALAIQCQVPMPRLTADVDVIMLASDASIAGSLGAAGWAPDRSMVHRWRLQGAVVDIIQVTDDDLLAGVVNLNGAELSVVGFDLAFSEGNAIRVTPATEVLVPPLPVLVLLKMIAWMDRPFDRAKDLGDIAHIWDHALSDDERWAEPNPWLDGSNLEYDDQGAFFVGLKLGQVAGPGHIHWAKRFLDQVRNEDSLAFAQFVRASHYAGDNAEAKLRGRLSAFELGLQRGAFEHATIPETAVRRGLRAVSGGPVWGLSGSLEQRIHDAIDNRLVVEFSYNGHRRVAEPHVLGVKNGRLQVLMYQIGGSSSSGLLPDWRRFFVDELSQLEVMSQAFVPQRLTFGRHSDFDRQVAVVRRAPPRSG